MTCYASINKTLYYRFYGINVYVKLCLNRSAKSLEKKKTWVESSKMSRSLQVQVKWRKGNHFRLKEQLDYRARSKRAWLV